MSQMILNNTDMTPEIVYYDTLPKLTIRLIDQIEEFPRFKYGVILEGANLLYQYDADSGHFFYDHEDADAMGKQTDEHTAVLEGMKKEFEERVANIQKERDVNKEEAVTKKGEPDATRLLELEKEYMPKLSKEKTDFEQECRNFIEGKGDIFIIRKRLEIHTVKGSLANIVNDLIVKAGL